MSGVLILSESDVKVLSSKFTPSELQLLMARVFKLVSTPLQPHEPPASCIPHRTSMPTRNHTALFMPARIAYPLSLSGTSIKVVSVPKSPTDLRGLPASTLVLDEDTGAVRALINATNLTALRNAAGSLLSTTLVGPRAPKNVVAFGAGRQIEAHLQLHLDAFRSIDRCTVVNRTINSRVLALKGALESQFPKVSFTWLANGSLPDNQSPELKDILLSSELIICATSSQTPLFPSSWVCDGSHVILIGSYTPQMHEVDRELVLRAIPTESIANSGLRRLLVDSRAACLAEAGELINAGVTEDITEIGELVSFDDNGELSLVIARETGRAFNGITLFKSVGIGLQDVAIARAIVDKAEAMELGTRVAF